ncbi:hypothetical protein [Endozoicomonas acroporae]|uniref:hypothetical protein n=1 Tax=Endozoicomonas acroporae TaxID=1701104 RepID=UPI003D79E953
MGDRIDDRVITVIKNYKSSRKWKELEELTGIDRDRWRSVSEGRVKVRTEELEAVIKLYPKWAHWLTTGDVLPESGQTSPEWDEAEKLNESERA